MTWTIGMSDADISTQTLAYTVASGREARLTVEFTNRSTSAAATIQLWVVPSGESVGNEHLKESGTTLSFAGTRQAVLTRNVIAPEGAKVYVQASTANVSCQVSGDVVAAEVNTSSIVDGTSSITYGTNWATYLSSTTLKKTGSIVVLQLSVIATGVVTPAGTVITIPVGYRPTKYVAGTGVLYDNSTSGRALPCAVTIGTNGTVTVFGLKITSEELPENTDIISASLSFFTS